MRDTKSSRDNDQTITTEIADGQRAAANIHRLAETSPVFAGLVEALRFIASDRCSLIPDSPFCQDDRCLECFQEKAYMTLEKNGLI